MTAGNIQDWNMPMIKGGGTFTTTLGNFTKIELNADWITDFSGTGWVKNGWQSQTWTGDAASVSYSGTIGGGGMTCDGGSMTITFTIEKPTVAVASISLSQTEVALNIGETLTLTATVAPDNATDQTVTWTSSDETVATVADGVVTAVAVGTVTIYAEANDGSGVKGNCTVTVTPAARTVTWNASDIVTVNPWDKSFTKDGITFAPGHADFLDKNFTNGGTFTTASGKFTKIEVTAPYVDISGTGWSGGSWTGDASSSVSYSGDIYDVGMGQLKIVFTIEESVAVTGVTLDKTEAALNIGETLTLTATVAPDNATDQTVTWTSSDETVATVADGVVTAVAVGTATITVTTTDGAKTATCAVTVAEPTYNVTVKEGTEDAANWTAEPNTGVKKGQQVTVTYSGTKKVIGVKAEKKSAAAAARPLAEAVAADLGKIAGADGNIYDTKAAAEAANTTAVAMIAYVGSSTEHGTYTHGLALALSDEGSMNWSTAKSSCEGKTAVTGAAWLLPSQSQWKTMFSANGGNEDDYTGLQTAANNAGGDGTLQNGSLFWTSTESGDNAYSVALPSGNSSVNFYSDPKTTPWKARACLAF